ncbi:MAG: hypothetical protein IKZ75_00325, partial [Oscillospiraceae bacterium]|nr:hypothetical protein [Oscillospiraceae bacterium]
LVDYAVILDSSVKIYEGSKEDLSVRDDIFSSIDINLPPVVRLSRRYGFDHISYNVPDFAEQAAAVLKEGGES